MFAFLCLLAPCAAPPTWRPGEYAALKNVEESLDDKPSPLPDLERMLAARLALYGATSWQARESSARVVCVRKLATFRGEVLRREAEFERLIGDGRAALMDRQFAKALKLGAAARAIAEANHGRMSYAMLMALNVQAVAALVIAPVDEAGRLTLEYLEVGLAMQGPDHPARYEVVRNAAPELHRRGGHRFAAEVYKIGLADLPPDKRGGLVGLTLSNNIAAYLSDAGDHPAALPYAQAAAAIWRRLRPRLPTRQLGSLGLMLRQGGDTEAAVELYDEAIRVARATPTDRALLPLLLRNRGMVARSLGDRLRARECFEEALRIQEGITGKTGGDYAILLDGYAGVMRLPEERMERLALKIRAVSLCRDASDVALAICLEGLGEALAALGDTHRALAVAERVVALRMARLGPKSYATIGAIGLLARRLRAAGDYRGSLIRNEEARRLAEQAGQIPLIRKASVVNRLGYWHEEVLDHGRAAAWHRRAAMQVLEHADTTFTAQGMEARLQTAADIRGYIGAYLDSSIKAGQRAERLYGPVLAYKGMVTARERQDALSRDDPALAPLLAGLRDARRRLPTLRGSALTAAERRIEETEEQVARRSAAIRAERSPAPADVAAALPDNAALVDIFQFNRGRPRPVPRSPWVTDPHLAAFVLRRGRDASVIDLGPSAPIAEAVTAWLKSVERASIVDSRAAEELRRLVWVPLEQHIGDSRLVLVAPDGPLCDLPFAALPGREKGKFLIEERAFGTLTSARQLLEAPSPHTGEGMIVLGGARHGAGKEGVWADLPGTELEARRLAAGGTLLSGEKASREELLYALAVKRPRRLHLATHGYFDPSGAAVRTPFLRCGLALAGANADASGRLTGEEVRGLDLRGCELVTLSACETGRGAARYGEGLLSLRQAFHLAGARAVVASHWAVSDPATSVLMERMYAAMDGKTSKWEALRRAQLFVLNNPEAVARRTRELVSSFTGIGLRGVGKAGDTIPGTGKARSHPAWWAAFTLSGDGR